MIRTPQIKRRIFPKTQSGHKLGAAMLWVAIGVVTGVALALLAFGAAELIYLGGSELLRAATDLCQDPPAWMSVVAVLAASACFYGAARAIAVVRRRIIVRNTPRLEDFARDTADWFAVGAWLGFVVWGWPLLALAVIQMPPCG